MQVTPALPWDDTIEGGVIHLAEPVTYQDILNGALQFILSINAQSVLAGINEGSAGIVIVNDNSQIIYQIESFEGQSSLINIERADGAPSEYSLEVVQLPVRLYTVNPSLPWNNEGEGEIEFSNPVSIQDILDKKILFYGEEAHTPRQLEPVDEGDKINLKYSTNTFFSIDKYEGVKTKIRLNDESAYNNLTNIYVAMQDTTPSLPWNGVNGTVIIDLPLISLNDVYEKIHVYCDNPSSGSAFEFLKRRGANNSIELYKQVGGNPTVWRLTIAGNNEIIFTNENSGSPVDRIYYE